MASAAVNVDPNSLGVQLQNMIDKLAESFKGMTDQMQQLGNSLQKMAISGLAATAEGNRLSFAWLMLSRQIASIFLPVINLAINGIMQLTQWFKSLTGEGQSIAMMMSIVAIGMKLLLPALEMLKGLFSPIAIAIGLLFEGLMQFLEGTTEGRVIMEALSVVFEAFMFVFSSLGDVFKVVVDGVVVAFQLVVRGFMWLGLKVVEVIEAIISWIPGLGDWAEALKEFREKGQAQFDMLAEGKLGADAKVNKDKKSNQVNPTGFGFESLSSSWERVMGAANKQDSIPTKQLATQEKMLIQLSLIGGAIGQLSASEVGSEYSGGGDY